MAPSGYGFLMPDTVESLRRDLIRLERSIEAAVSHDLYRAELDDLQSDVEKVEHKLDRIIQTQLSNQRTAIWQLIAIIVTLAVAAWGAFT